MIPLPDRLGDALRSGARAWLLVVAGWSAWVALWGDPALDPEGGPLPAKILIPVQVSLAALTALGVWLSERRATSGLIVGALGAIGLGVAAALHLAAPLGLLVLLASVTPTVLWWLAWQRGAPPGRIGAIAAGTALLLGGVWAASATVYESYFGATHPESTTVARPPSPVRWVWSGAVRPTGFSVTARLHTPAAAVRLVVRDVDGAEIGRSDPVAVPDPVDPVTLVVDDLTPATEYQYALELDGEIDEVAVGRARTFPSEAASFTVALASCARTGSNGSVFDTIREFRPDLYVNIGDLHYRDIADDDPAQFRAAYDQVHASPAQSALYRSLPIAYVWDDHDYGPNNSDTGAQSRPAAWASYRTHVPHYDLPAGDDGPIYQAFSIGRVRFILSDTRSHRDRAAGTMLGEDQLDWLLDEIEAASADHALTVWISPTPWIGPPDPSADQWAGFAAERDRIGSFLDEHDISNFVVVSGDAHMVAIDDGTNSGYGGHQGFPVLQAGALDRPGSAKGGPYSHGTFPGGGQFGMIDVTDPGGDQIAVHLAGYDHTGAELVSLSAVFDVG